MENLTTDVDAQASIPPVETADVAWKILLAKSFSLQSKVTDYVVIAFAEDGSIAMSDFGRPYIKLGMLEHLKALITKALTKNKQAKK